MAINKEAMIDAKGAPITQGLFLETSYGDTKHVMYTLKSRDYVYKGKRLPSIKKIYLAMEDPTEYEFAYEAFLDWDHWNRIKANKLIAKHMEGWKDELDVRLACKELRNLQAQSDDGKTAATNKMFDFLVKGVRGAGRPSKDEVERQAKMEARVYDEFQEDLARMR